MSDEQKKEATERKGGEGLRACPFCDEEWKQDKYSPFFYTLQHKDGCIMSGVFDRTKLLKL